MKRILIWPNPLKKPALELAGNIISQLQNLGFEPVLEQTIAEMIGNNDCGRSEATLWQDIDLVLVLGGDGSMLNAARRIYPRQIPLLGINLGQLGFLTRIECHKIEAALRDIRSGSFQFEERTMLQAEVVRNEQKIFEMVALNDLVVAAGSLTRMIRLETWIDKEFFTTYPADGLIVATATGSTAYSLSAGGPILDPRLEALIVTPICAHSLYARPVVLHRDAQVKVVLNSPIDELTLTGDGQSGIDLQSGDEIHFYRAPYITKLIRLDDKGLFEVLKTRFKEGRI